MRNIILLFLLSIISCSKSTDYSSVGFFKYVSGTIEFGDVINPEQVRNDTLYSFKKPIGVVTILNKRIMSNDIVIEIRSIRTSQVASFVSK